MIVRYLVIASLLPTSILSAQAGAAIPASLAAALERHGCVEIINHADFQNLRGNWWVPLEAFTGLETDFAFFCHDKTDHMETRFIVEAKGEKSPWKACPEIVETWPRYHRDQIRPHLPIDLEIVSTSARYSHLMDLGRWWRVDSSRSPNVVYGSDGTKVPALVLDTTGQSAGGVYTCLEAKWYTWASTE